MYATGSSVRSQKYVTLFGTTGQRLRLFRLLEKKMPSALSFLRCATPNHFCYAKDLVRVQAAGV